MKKVLIFSSTPRKNGNSEILCEEFARGAREAGHTVETVCLREQSINFCRGCMACMSTGKCVQKDGMAALLDKMMEADVIVLATPVYFYNVSAQLKVLIDRTCPIYERLTGREFYYILTAADTERESMERVVEGLRGFTVACLEDPIERGTLYALGLEKTGEAKDSPYLSEAYAMGKEV